MVKCVTLRAKGAKLYQADCREVLPRIPDASVGLVLTDPPYGVRHYDGDLSVWKIPSQPDPDHPCVFPEEIPRRCILATTSPGDLVLDCFSGAGTTGLAALATGQRFVGIELDPNYAALAVSRWRERIRQGGLVTRVEKRRRAT